MKRCSMAVSVFLLLVFGAVASGPVMAQRHGGHGFGQCRLVKPPGSRTASREIYLLGLNRRVGPAQKKPPRSPRPGKD